MSAHATALLCALVVASATLSRAYTVDCNHEYTDCDSKLRKLVSEDDDLIARTGDAGGSTLPLGQLSPIETTPESTSTFTRQEKRPEVKEKETVHVKETTETTTAKRVIDMNVDELQKFANAVHNSTVDKTFKKNPTDFSDIEDEEEDPKIINAKNKDISDKFYSNLQAPFNQLMGADKGSDESETCRENGVFYKIGDHMERGCDEICECASGGIFDCSPRCKLPYIRRGRRLNDPMCVESPVDECCSIMACANGNRGKPINEDDDLIARTSNPGAHSSAQLTPIETTPEAVNTFSYQGDTTTDVEATDATENPETLKPKPRLLNLSGDELQNFANSLHNRTSDTGLKKHPADLSDINLDDDDEPKSAKNKDIVNKFYTNMQVPFHPMMHVDRGSEEVDACRENDISYKIGEHIQRGCEEICECVPGGVFDCSPRCKVPYIRRGRRLNDPLCVESPVDECCSIIACATGNGDQKVTKLEVCRHRNDTYPVGSKWHIGCEETCTCEPNSIVTCKPRCNPLQPSDKCINVQDPNDACCEVQVCDVSNDAHEEQENATSSTSTSTTTESHTNFATHDAESRSNRPLVLVEPIGSVKVLQNNSVQVNLIHPNNTEDPIHLMLSNDGGKQFEDVELTQSNLILNLKGGKDYILKTKETGTKFNFTITTTDAVSNEVPIDESQNETKGCYQDGEFYAVGEEFRIGCTELCECVGPNQRECVALVCPSHVGLELVSKGCVQWAPNPPAQPPNCCPRSARCLSDGTCHYKGVPVPNWTEVPLTLTGCEERCFCENGELDCQEVCSPVPALPPQSLRCPPHHRPAPVNISDEDCCKQWGCVPNANQTNELTLATVVESPVSYTTPLPEQPSTTPVLEAPTQATPSVSPKSSELYKYIVPLTTNQNYIPPTPPTFTIHYPEKVVHGDNITVFTFDDSDAPIKVIVPEPKQMIFNDNYHFEPLKPEINPPFKVPLKIIYHNSQSHLESPVNLATTKPKVIHQFIPENYGKMNMRHDPIRKIPQSKLNTPHFFLLNYLKKLCPAVYTPHYTKPELGKGLFKPEINNGSENYILSKAHTSSLLDRTFSSRARISSDPKETTLKKPDITRIKVINMNQHSVPTKDGNTEHLLTKNLTPYQTVLYRVPKVNENDQNENLGKPYSALDIENLLRQMEAESIVTKNLGRSADKCQETSAGQQIPTNMPPPPPRQPAFLPTIRPEIHFPQDDITDFDRNNIHNNPLNPTLHLPPGLNLPPGYGDGNNKLSVLSIQADSPTSVKMLFGLPPVLVGLRGSVDLRYTDKADEDVSKWYSQVFAPADEILTTPRLEFRLAGLKPSTLYRVRGKLFLHNLPVEPESDVYTVRTQDPVVEEKLKEIDTRLTVSDVNDTAARVTWRRFSDEELQYIDGIQVRYRPVGTPIYSMTELLHHSRISANLIELRPGSSYEASLVLIPPPKSTTELRDPATVEFQTSPYVDPYNWSVVIEARAVGSEAAEIEWRGVPSPAERWVRVYRAAHACTPPSQSGSTVREHDAFRLATRDLPATITLSGLASEARCRVWLELFLTNGKIKTSNVLEINTKSLDSPEPIDNEIEASSISDSRRSTGDYYSALVGVGIVAALGALTSLLLLLIVLRRHRPRSLPITSVPTAPRESSLPPYDNPAYKLELQQETMDL